MWISASVSVARSTSPKGDGGVGKDCTLSMMGNFHMGFL
jgi:hypothetical protein